MVELLVLFAYGGTWGGSFPLINTANFDEKKSDGFKNRTNGTVKRGPTRVAETGRIAYIYSVITAGLLRVRGAVCSSVIMAAPQGKESTIVPR